MTPVGLRSVRRPPGSDLTAVASGMSEGGLMQDTMSLVHGAMSRCPRSIGEYFLHAGLARPGQAAVLREDECLTYEDLALGAECLAAELAERGIGRGDRVLVECDPIPQAVVVLVACSLLGAIYVPVAPDVPLARKAAIAGAARPAAHAVAAGQPVAAEIPVRMRLSPGGVAVSGGVPGSSERVRGAPTEHDVAYLIFTSGTTGRPKGIMMTHRAALAFFRGMARQLPASPQHRVASFAPLNFDFSLLDLGWATGAGGTLVQVPRMLLRHPRRFVEHLARMGVSHVSGVPSIWSPVLRHATQELSACTSLRGLVIGGEAYPVELLRALWKALPGVQLVNVFGQSESIACSFLELPDPLPDDLRQVPIGPAHPGAEMLVLDDAGREVGVGETGELFLRSDALFSGYWLDADATGRTLVPPPGDPEGGERVLRTGDLLRRERYGLFTFAGRKDLQVKIHGNRVELGEVESHLAAHPAVTEALVVTVNGDLGTRLAALVAVVTGGEEHHHVEEELRAWCSTRLPPYMQPTYVLVVPALPRTVGGKLDRRAAHGMALRLIAAAPGGAPDTPAHPAAANPRGPCKHSTTKHPLPEPSWLPGTAHDRDTPTRTGTGTEIETETEPC
ncbi:amino acid adenylation domain-containing protein [Streptomyces sp. YGL11-2]|uniref:amino acid adenylation domain-containing protein n=1 Tax=Streptomyces sp. YGL11-2 TaxID=3414028 RepID=UPI003CE71928